MAQERRIEKDIAENTTLVTDKIDLLCLLKEYPDEDDVYRKKIKVGPVH